MSDRLLVMHKGMIKGELVGKNMSADNVMKLVIE
jgi:ABC-type sugar transport system ATPase subunit